jgi:hypothetical protein
MGHSMVVEMELEAAVSSRLDHIQRNLLSLPGCCHAQEYAHCIRNPAAFADHPAHIFSGDPQFQPDFSAAAPRLSNLYLPGFIHKRGGNVFDQFLHGVTPFHP